MKIEVLYTILTKVPLMAQLIFHAIFKDISLPFFLVVPKRLFKIITDEYRKMN